MKCPRQCAKQALTRKPHYKTTTIRPWHQHMTWNSRGSARSNPWNANPIRLVRRLLIAWNVIFITRGQFEHAPTMNSPARAQSLLFPPWRWNLCGKEQHVALSPNFHQMLRRPRRVTFLYSYITKNCTSQEKSHSKVFLSLFPRCFLLASCLFSSLLFFSLLFFSLLFSSLFSNSLLFHKTP